MPELSVVNRVRGRWQAELEELRSLTRRTDGRLAFVEATDGLDLFIQARSPIFGEGGRVETPLQPQQHHVSLIRPPDWPAVKLELVHRSPVNVLHPNILYLHPEDDDRPGIREFLARRGLTRGAICWCDRWSPALRLSMVVQRLYGMLSYSPGAFGTGLDVLSPAAVRWANLMLSTQPSIFPTDDTPLIARTPGGTPR